MQKQWKYVSLLGAALLAVPIVAEARGREPADDTTTTDTTTNPNVGTYEMGSSTGTTSGDMRAGPEDTSGTRGTSGTDSTGPTGPAGSY